MPKKLSFLIFDIPEEFVGLYGEPNGQQYHLTHVQDGTIRTSCGMVIFEHNQNDMMRILDREPKHGFTCCSKCSTEANKWMKKTFGEVLGFRRRKKSPKAKERFVPDEIAQLATASQRTNSPIW